MSKLADFAHRFEAGSDASRPLLLALHGTGGDERDLLPVARMIDPHAAVLSPRGRVLEHGMPRFFRRLAEGVFDQEDLRLRTRELSDFILEAADHYRFDASRIVAVGYSNGANIAASLLLTADAGVTFAGAILLRPMVPFEPEAPPNLSATKILISASRQDQIVPPPLTERLAALLTSAGASVTTRWYRTGHALSQREIDEAASWYKETFR
jgi:phospholipase/carboxylesterase